MNAQTVQRFRSTILLCLVAIIVIYAIQNLISPSSPVMQPYFGFGNNPVQLSIIQFTIMFIGGASMVAFGYLSDKVKRVRILFAGALVFSIPSILTVFVGPGLGGYTLFFVLQVIASFGLGMTYPTSFSLTGDIISKNERSRGFSYFSIATTLGMVIADLTGSLVAPIYWQASYIIFGVTGLVCAGLLLLLKEPSRLGRDFLNLASKDEVDYSYRIRREDLKAIFKKKSNLWLIINFVSTVPTGILLYLLYDYMLYTHNVPEWMATFFLGFIVVALFAGIIVFGVVADSQFKKGHKKAKIYACVISNTAPIPFIIIGLFQQFTLPDNGTIGELFALPGAQIMIVMFTIGIFLCGGFYGPWYATVVDLNLPEHRGTVLSFANFFETFGKAIGPPISSALASYFALTLGMGWSIGYTIGMGSSVIFMAAIPFFWIEIIRHFVPEFEETEKIFQAVWPAHRPETGCPA